jgi:hypothetical protein
MTERQSAHDHPRSDDVKGRDRHDGEDEKGIGDKGDFGDQGISQSTDPEHQRNQAAAPIDGSGRDAGPPDAPGA